MPQEIIAKQADLRDIFPPDSPSTVLFMQPPSGKVWNNEPVILPRDIRHLAAQGEKTWMGIRVSYSSQFDLET